MMQLVCVTGHPLGGKTTLARWLADHFHAEYWSSGDFAREHGLDPMEQGIKERGVSFALNSKINEEAHRRLGTRSPILIMDGFPRTYEQVTMVRKRCPLVLFVMISPVVMWARMRLRGRNDDVREVVGAKVLSSLDLFTVLREEETLRVHVVNGESEERMKQEGLRWCDRYLAVSSSGR